MAESCASLPPEFISKLDESILKHDPQGRGEIDMSVVHFQADPSIADAVIRGGCEAIISGDSDFAMYIGPGGPDNIMICDVIIDQKQSTIISGTLIMGQQKPL
jgi:hypothetical protein